MARPLKNIAFFAASPCHWTVVLRLSVPKVDFCWADHVPDGYTPVLAARHHHTVPVLELETKHTQLVILCRGV